MMADVVVGSVAKMRVKGDHADVEISVKPDVVVPGKRGGRRLADQFVGVDARGAQSPAEPARARTCGRGRRFRWTGRRPIPRPSRRCRRCRWCSISGGLGQMATSCTTSARGCPGTRTTSATGVHGGVPSTVAVALARRCERGRIPLTICIASCHRTRDQPAWGAKLSLHDQAWKARSHSRNLQQRQAVCAARGEAARIRAVSAGSESAVAGSAAG